MKVRASNDSVTTPLGFLACGVPAGIKVGRDDMALIVSLTPATAAALFTSNKFAAAPVVLDRELVASGHARAIVANAGCANAGTGAQGMEDAKAMAAFAAESLGLPEKEVLVASTGVIGRRLPMDRIRGGIEAAAQILKPLQGKVAAKLAAGDAKGAARLTAKGGKVASKAILTTDTREKRACASFTAHYLDKVRDPKTGKLRTRVSRKGVTVTVAGMCKGAGMIEPNLATMLAFLTTDATVPDAALLRSALKKAADKSFNRLTVDGDQSTNDSLFLLANGAAGANAAWIEHGTADAKGGTGAPVLDASHPDWPAFEAALEEVCLSLARQIAADGEGATKLVTVRVCGAASDADALLAAKTIANSPLCKTAWFGGDPNWGRILSATGDSGVALDPEKARILFDDTVVYDCGRIADEATLKKLEKICSQKTFAVTMDIGLGSGDETVYTCDFSYEYVKINGEYTT